MHKAYEAKRTHANKVKLCLKTGATGHAEGNDIVLRSFPSCTRAPSVRKRHGSVSMVAAAPGVVLNTARRSVSRHT